jgi:hypothetical protein
MRLIVLELLWKKRFSREEIETMLKQNGFVNIRFSNNPPYWHVVAQRP